MMRVFPIFAAMTLLSACGESAQVQSAGRHMPDVEPWKGAQNAYVVKGWTPGDKTAWENQMRTRSQSQNEYNKVN